MEEYYTYGMVFPSLVHRRIFMERAFIVPPGVSLQNTQSLSPELVEGCLEYHEFLRGFLADMYDDPERFGLPAGAFEDYLGGEKPHMRKRREPAAYDRVRSVTYAAGMTYLRYLLSFCLKAKREGDSLCLGAEEYGERLVNEGLLRDPPPCGNMPAGM